MACPQAVAHCFVLRHHGHQYTSMQSVEWWSRRIPGILLPWSFSDLGWTQLPPGKSYRWPYRTLLARGRSTANVGGCHKCGYPKMPKWIVYILMENPIRMDDLGVPLISRNLYAAIASHCMQLSSEKHQLCADDHGPSAGPRVRHWWRQQLASGPWGSECGTWIFMLNICQLINVN